MHGMNKRTGQPLEGMAHLKQSIIDILTTPIGTRVMRREYGSRIYQLVDNPMDDEFAIELFAATAEALEKWEPRFRLEQVQIDNISEGKVTLLLSGVYLPNGEPIRLDGIII